MDDACSMRGGEGVRDLNGDLQRLIEWQRSFFQVPLQRFAIQILHHQKVDSVLGTYVEDWTNVWVTEGRQRLGFTLEPLLQFRIRGDVRGQHFDGDSAVKPCVARSIHFPHSALSDQGGDHIGAKPRLRGKRHLIVEAFRLLAVQIQAPDRAIDTFETMRLS